MTDYKPGNYGWTLTYTGRKVYLSTIGKSDLCLADIAHALSLTCRFGGHCRSFYSVAQHSVLCSVYADQFDINPRVALMHDGAEAYLPDVLTPHKQMFPRLTSVIGAVQSLVFERYVPEYSGLVKAASMQADYRVVDREMLLAEMKALMRCDWAELPGWHEPLVAPIEPWTSVQAEEAFLLMAQDLGISDD